MGGEFGLLGGGGLLGEPVEAELEFVLAVRGGVWVEDWVPGRHDGGAGDEGVVEGGGVPGAAGGLVGLEDLLGGGGVVLEDEGVPDDGGEVPFDGAEEGVFPVGPEEAAGGGEEVSFVGIAVEGLHGEGGEGVEGGVEVAFEEVEGGLGEEVGVFEEFAGFVEDGERGEWVGELAEDAVAVEEGGAGGGGGGWGVGGGDELPEVEGVAEVLVGAGGEGTVEGDDGCAVGGKVDGDGVFTGEPSVALARAIAIGDDAGDEGFAEAEDEGVAVLEDVATVRSVAEADGGFGGGADGEGGGHGWVGVLRS